MLEANAIGWGASGRNGGQFASGQRADQRALEARAGVENGRALWHLAEDGKALLRRLVADHGIDCALTDGHIRAEYTARGVADAAREAEHLARHLDYGRITMLDRGGIASATGSRAFAGGWVDAGGGHLHPLAYARGLARAAAAAGARLHAGTRVVALEEDGARPTLATAAGHRVRAERVLLALNGYHGGLEASSAARVLPIANYIVATEPLGAAADGLLPGGEAAADSRFVVNYWRRAQGRLLFGGGETYRYRYPADIRALVRPRLEALYPQLRGVALTHAWGGTLGITRSRLPAIGARDGRVFWAGGFSGHGIVIGTLAGRLMAEAAAGEGKGFALMARHAPPGFPGGRLARHPLMVLGMLWFAARDRLGF